jgi:hypothetical protein
MNRLLTSEEMAFLLAGLREAEGGQEAELGAPPPELISTDRDLAEPGQIASCPNFSNWLMAMTDLRWLHR